MGDMERHMRLQETLHKEVDDIANEILIKDHETIDFVILMVMTKTNIHLFGGGINGEINLSNAIRNLIREYAKARGISLERAVGDIFGIPASEE